MKKIRYAVLGYTDVYDPETGKTVSNENVAMIVTDFSAHGEETVKQMAHNGEYEIFDDENTLPTQLDAIEAQVTYTAMMTDTLLEV